MVYYSFNSPYKALILHVFLLIDFCIFSSNRIEEATENHNVRSPTISEFDVGLRYFNIILKRLKGVWYIVKKILLAHY